MSSICIIPARGGSKRIYRKNIKDFCGKPIIAYSIEAAVESGVFDEIMVSTDDQEIESVALNYGAAVPFKRSAELSDDYATTVDVIFEVLEEYRVKQNKEFEIVCCLYPCAPFVTAKRLREGFLFFDDDTTDSVMTICKFPAPIEWALRIYNGLIIPDNIGALNIRSQDLVTKYFDAGQWYFSTKNSLDKTKMIEGGACRAVVLSECETEDIDTIEDWDAAEAKYQIFRKSLL